MLEHVLALTQNFEIKAFECYWESNIRKKTREASARLSRRAAHVARTKTGEDFLIIVCLNYYLLMSMESTDVIK